MTLKHIEFYDSAVMRELERQTIKKGDFVSDISSIIKKASKTSYASTGDLFLDLIKLAAGLREKGFVEEANNLEEKIVNYKRASNGSVYSSELDNAHPDGDVTMGEAANGLGDVETLESAHEKILEVVKKQPTGKLAKEIIVENILKASENILGIKKAQDAQDNFAEESPEDIFSGKTESRIATITEINNFLSSEFPKVSNLLKSIGIDVSKWVFRYQDLYNGTPEFRALYANYAEIDSILVERFFKEREFLYGKDFIGDEQARIVSVLQQYAGSKNINGMIQYGNMVGGNLGTKYFSGSQPSSSKKEFAAKNSDQANNPIFRDNPNSIWKWDPPYLFDAKPDNFSIDETKLAVAAKEIQQAHYNNFQALFSDEKLNLATTKIQEQVKQLTFPWNKVTEFFDNIPQLPNNAVSSAVLNVAVNTQANNLNEYLEDGKLSTALIGLINVMWPDWDPNITTLTSEIINEIENIVNFLNSKPLNPMDVVVTNIDEAATVTLSLGKAFFEAAKSLDPKSSNFQIYRTNYYELAKIINALRNGLGKPYSFIYEKIKNSFPKATTYEALVNEINNFASEYSELFAQAGVDLTQILIKQAQLVRKTQTPGGELTAKQPSNNSVPKSNSQKVSPDRARLGLAKANMNDPKEVAVATMQQHLAYFAEALSNEAAKNKFKSYDPQDVARIVRTGPKANPAVNTYDGKWGAQTQAALELANKYIGQLGLNELDTSARYVNRKTSDDAERVAKANSAILSQGIRLLGGKKGTDAIEDDSTVYDRLPDKINWNDVKYPLMQHKNPITSNDLSSLGALYDLIIKNGWLEPQYMQDAEGFDIEGFTAKQWGGILQWFQRRAQFIYNSSIRINREAASLAREYYEAAKTLEGQLRSFFANYGFSSQNETDIVNIEILRQYSAGLSKGKRGPGRSASETAPGETPFRGTPREAVPRSGLQYANYRQIDEGTDWKSPTGGDDGPPIDQNGVINLSSRWFQGLDEKLGISHNPLLNPDIFRRYPAGDLARTFYANAGGNVDEQARRQALVAVGLEVDRYDEAAQDYIVYWFNPATRRRETTYAMRVPAYQKAYKARLTAGPIRSFGALLQTISASLGPAIAEWIRATQPNNTAKQAEQAWHVEWQRILGMKANEAAGA